jgi:hypothetical protein
MVPDVPAVIPLYHDDAGIVVHGDHAHGDPGEELANDRRMPQGVHGDFRGVEIAALRCPGK